MQGDLPQQSAEECIRIAEEYLRHAANLLSANESHFRPINPSSNRPSDNIAQQELFHEQDPQASETDLDERSYVGEVVRSYKPQLV
jgi:hypothetical protein